ncbi:unnamed protein product [Cuscuta epithymum]|uniref:Uncharacterized protein n=1 Tax=Cuscuta epithymum TaxID=186058 RepID=A0AAV0DJU3_9ASTE|nr:unnamed protein product [Cuscuta epithymum]
MQIAHNFRFGKLLPAVLLLSMLVLTISATQNNTVAAVDVAKKLPSSPATLPPQNQTQEFSSSKRKVMYKGKPNPLHNR